MKKFKKVITIILDFAIVCVSILLFFNIFLDIQTTFLKKTYKSFFGFSVFEIKTGSMTNTINVGDCILVKNTKNIKLNDIVTYEENGNFITHRVVQQYANTYVTKGDHNNTSDEPIYDNQIVGKVIKIFPNTGIIKNTLFNNGVLIPLIVILFVICLIVDDKEDEHHSYIKLLKSSFKRKKVANVPEDIEIPSDVVSESKTTILSKVEVKKNNSVYSVLIDKKTEEDEPKIIKVLK